MNRCCYKCGKDLSIEPAIKGLRGLLCFTCRYKLDEAGGERFVVETELYPERQAAWQAEFGKQWEMRSRLSNRLNRFSALAFISAGVILVALYFSIQFVAAPAVLYLVVLLIVDLCVCFGLSTLAEKCKGSPPPNKPQKNPIALSSEPTLLFDGNSNADLNPKFTHYRPCNPQDSPYPPDWNERRIKCFIRDNRQCRLCKEQKRNLQAHHVIPRSRDGSHSLQNLITLCAKCHEKQEYYGHKTFIEVYQELSPEDFVLEAEIADQSVLKLDRNDAFDKESAKTHTEQSWMNFGNAQNPTRSE